MNTRRLPKVTFGIVVLNGEPFTRYCIRALYPFAHQIVVAEGACPAAALIATPDGHSTDGTLDVLRRLKAEEDPESKLVIVTAEDEGHADGFWPGEKHEQSRACARRATGEYLWQVDIDEFYRPDDMTVIFDMLRDDPGIAGISFRQITFWGGFEYVADSWYLHRGAEYCHRVFQWGPGFQYVTHRPPTVHDARGRDLRTLRWIGGRDLARRGIVLLHYSLVFPKQVREKCVYYDRADWTGWNRYCEWAEKDFLALKNPYRVHNVYTYPSWLERYDGDHPPQIEAMRRDIREGRLRAQMRDTHDVERVLSSTRYRAGRAALKVLDRLDHWGRKRCRPGDAGPGAFLRGVLSARRFVCGF